MIIEQTHDEKVKMYMKSSKKELINMLIESNRHLERIIPIGPKIPITPITSYIIV